MSVARVLFVLGIVCSAVTISLVALACESIHRAMADILQGKTGAEIADRLAPPGLASISAIFSTIAFYASMWFVWAFLLSFPVAFTLGYALWRWWSGERNLFPLPDSLTGDTDPD